MYIDIRAEELRNFDTMTDFRFLLLLSMLACVLYYVVSEEKKGGEKKPQHPKLDQYAKEAPNRPTQCQGKLGHIK